jgi:hypothetical protein
VKRRWTYTSGGVPLEEPVEVTPDLQGHCERAPLFTDRFMEKDVAQDGTDISSRSKRREYMKAHGLADAADFKEHWSKAEQRRRDPSHGREAVGDTIARAWHQIENSSRRK